MVMVISMDIIMGVKRLMCECFLCGGLMVDYGRWIDGYFCVVFVVFLVEFCCYVVLYFVCGIVVGWWVFVCRCVWVGDGVVCCVWCVYCCFFVWFVFGFCWG